MQRERLNVEIPESFRCQVTTKVGAPLGKSRTSVGKPTELTMSTATSFGVIYASVMDVVAAAVAEHHAVPTNTKLAWQPAAPATPNDIYVKTAANTTQDKYVKLTLQNYSDVLQQVWDNASKIEMPKHHSNYCLHRKETSTAIRRATSSNIATAALRVADFIRDQNVVLGPLQTDYVGVVAARLPVTAPVEIPSNATMDQLGHIDSMIAQHADARRREITSQNTETYRRVRMRLGTMVSSPVDIFLSVEDLRSILGIPPFDLTPTFRAPVVGDIPVHSINVEDIDHINE
ncbi:Aste57867_20824 [Aphanomyces stellatus]|uniref:Aste57867_20824 protein n=1 Tax=Aphanomyces stellatus TaxID=120398 RepID=A0A485LG19_9STRA|nr:hypothetical protein As57867_020756 [Aphanomyces stellatus]VFT97503.1 Aste57867_20824 [Aphanomyces stellatus]